jgi:hypothetical protein
MSFILNIIREKVANAIEVNVQPAQYNRYPVIVTDKTDSVTSGWQLVYHVTKSYGNELFCGLGRFSELHIPRFGELYALIQTAYNRFINGENVTQRFNNRTATYPLDDKLWFTVFQRKDNVGITVTVIDEKSPFHMLTMNFTVVISSEQGTPYLVGFDKTYDQNTDTYTDRYNSFMLPGKKRFIPIHKSGVDAPSLVRVAGTMANNNMVQINEQATEIVYIQEMSNERRMLAGIYEKCIMKIAFEKAKDIVVSQQANTSFAQFGAGALGTWNQGNQTPWFQGVPQQAPMFGQATNMQSQQTQQPMFGQTTEDQKTEDQKLDVSDELMPF